jgi:hypothetical protein
VTSGLIAVIASLTVAAVLEIAKWLVRRGVLGKVE